MGRILYEVYFTLSRVFRELIPLPQNRKLLTWNTLPYAIGYAIPFLFMGYLARRKNTYFIRLLLLPSVLVVTIRGTFGYGDLNNEFPFYVWLRSLCGLTTVAMTLDFAFSQEGKLKAGEMSLPAIHEEPERVPSSPSSDSSTTTTSCRSETLAERTLPSSLMDAFEVSFELRGIGWQFGRDVHVVRETRPLQRHAFLRANVECLFKNYLVLDICLATFKLLPGVGTTFGGSMYYASLPLMYRYAVALAITALSGFTLISGFHVFNSIATLIGVGLLHQSPAQWPPIIDNPWSADSLHDFWTKRWHQALRRTFLVFGGIPGSWVAGRPGLVLGAFLASGQYHEVGTYMIGRGVDHRVTLFFFLQRVGVLLEKAYRWSTGHRLGGPLGRVWTYLFVVGLGQMALDSWFRRGLAGGIIIPPSISPSTNFLIPLIRRMIG